VKRGLAAAAAALLVATGCGGDRAVAVDDHGSAPADYSYTIPLGAGEAFDRGEPLDILPAELDVHVGEVIQIVNDDDRGHLVGPFYVGAGETLRQRFSTPGEFIGLCEVHPSGQLVLEVREP
jgi:plastocyanin